MGSRQSVQSPVADTVNCKFGFEAFKSARGQLRAASCELDEPRKLVTRETGHHRPEPIQFLLN